MYKTDICKPILQSGRIVNNVVNLIWTMYHNWTIYNYISTVHFLNLDNVLYLNNEQYPYQLL